MFRLTHTFNDCVALGYHDRPLFQYVYKPQTPAVEAPRPYFHPLHTLAGDVVTIFRPRDHRWHHGLSMTCAHLSGENFWGGPTYVRDRGYVLLDNLGRQAHQAWEDMQCAADRVSLREWVQWVTHTGATWIDEQRRIEVAEVNVEAGYWRLDLGFRLQNVYAQPLIFSSPTVEGRPQAGYGGLFWRGVRAFTGGKIMLAGGLEAEGSEESVMGRPAPWLAYIGQHDGVDRSSTLLFIDSPGNPRYPNKWFVRAGDYAVASFAFSFDAVYTLDPGAVLDLNYRIVIADGAWSREQIEAYVRV